MIKHLQIQNIVLVEHASLAFHPGLNILTGETGSGKSAILYGLGLAVGERTDTSLIRHGCEKGWVEAHFEVKQLSTQRLLEEGGIEHAEDEDLIIRREIAGNGKGKIFINQQAVQLTFLRKLGQNLVQMVGQHANQSLLSLDTHRDILDLYGDLKSLAELFGQSHDQEKSLRERLAALIQQESQRVREIDVCRQELDELEEAQVKEGEEEELFAEYTLLSNGEEISQKLHEVIQCLSGERNPLLAVLNRQKQALDTLVRFDPSLEEIARSFQNAYLELEDVSHTLQQYKSRIHSDPERLQTVNERLTLLNRLKRKYGSSVQEILAYQANIKSKLSRLENAEVEIEELTRELHEAEKETNRIAGQLSASRKKIAADFEKALTKHLRTLNMAKALFTVRLTPQPRTRHGDDRVEFFLCPNPGESEISLKEGASGGEMSRVLLALQTLLAGKEAKGTLIFDEVDANIGGETAAIVGEKLREISQSHQVICITHFPQVASYADHHLQISKEEIEGRTLTIVQELDEGSRDKELARMAGKKCRV